MANFSLIAIRDNTKEGTTLWTNEQIDFRGPKGSMTPPLKLKEMFGHVMWIQWSYALFSQLARTTQHYTHTHTLQRHDYSMDGSKKPQNTETYVYV